MSKRLKISVPFSLLTIGIVITSFVHLKNNESLLGIAPEKVDRIQISYIPFKHNSNTIPIEKIDSVIQQGTKIHLADIKDFNEFNVVIEMLNYSRRVDSVRGNIVYQIPIDNNREDMYNIAFIDIIMKSGDKIEWTFYLGNYAVCNGIVYDVYMSLEQIITWYIKDYANIKSCIEQ